MDRKDVAMRVCLFEDRSALDLEPLSLTRPVFDLLCGQAALADKQFRHFGPSERGALVRPYLADVCRLQSPGFAVTDLAWLRAAPVVLVNGRWLPPPFAPGRGTADVSGPAVALLGEEITYAVLEPEHLADCSPNTLDD